MIQASQSQAKSKKANLAFHKEISRNRFWERKLFIASIISAALLFVLWLVAVPIFYRLGILIISFLAALLIKTKDNKHWAFSWIAKSIGLSYETALELNQNDPYKLNEAVLKRAKTLSLKLEKPQQNLWWLPIIALAIGFAVLPFSPFKGSKIFSGLNPNSINSSSSEIENSSDISQEDPEANLEDNPELSSLSNDDAPTDDNELEQKQNEGLSDGISEDKALSDFIDNVKQRDKSRKNSEGQAQKQEQQAQNPFNSIQELPQNPEVSEQSGTGQQEQEGQEQSQDGQQNNSGQQSSSPSEQEQQSGQDEKSDGDSSADATEQGQNQENKANDEQQEEGQEEQSQIPASSDNSNAEQGQPEDQGQNSNQQSTDQNDPQADQPLGEGEKGEDGVGKDPTAETQGNNNPDVIEAAQNQPDFLEGELKQAESNQAGTVRLAGTQDNKGSTANNKAIFNRSQEEAISEGSIPLEYQEIIRNYFR